MVNRDLEEQLDLGDIQGDVLYGLQKEFELFVGFAIQDVARFKTFLSSLAITTSRDVKRASIRIAAYKANGGTGHLDIRGTNIAFTIDGLHKLGVTGLAGIGDAAFKEGLAKRSTLLNDPTSGDSAVANWLVGNGVGPLDGMVLLTGKDEPTVSRMLTDLNDIAGNSWVPFFVGHGKTRPDPHRGHEHFGFLDGVSQPAVRGRIDHYFPHEKFFDPNRVAANPGQGLPGADLHWPGAFVFGYQSQEATSVDTPGPIADGGLPWMKNGSFMVYRRLEQLVPEFDAEMNKGAQAAEMDADQYAARLVGRFKSGWPISKGSAGNPGSGDDEMKNNDFEFGSDDPDGAKCPFAAHIRKSYPRNDLTRAGSTEEESEADIQTRRIRRAGIPFGPEVESAEKMSKTTHHSRGLMFVCYQTSIVDQFEFVTRNWVNNPDFAVPLTGEDPIIGQSAAANRERDVRYGPTPPVGSADLRVKLPADFVRPTGGGYFFVPSITAIATVLSV